MKKLILFIALTTICFTACTSNTSTESTSDSTVIDSTNVDTIALHKGDSVIVQTPVTLDSTVRASDLLVP
jgi:uncharacterized protein YcfL